MNPSRCLSHSELLQFSNIHRALGCVGGIIDGGIRDVDEMCNAGFKALARRLPVGHGYAVPVRWGCDVEVFGRKVQPGQLIHADKHGFIAIPEGEEQGLPDAARFMDANECEHLISAARGSGGKQVERILREIDAGAEHFGQAAKERFVVWVCGSRSACFGGVCGESCF